MDVAVIAVQEQAADAWDRVQASLRAAAGDPGVRAVVIVGNRQPHSGPPALPLMIEDCPLPVVVAIPERAFGYGLEIALAAHYRVSAPAALMALPEVNLGLIPASGGTQRLPRLAGFAVAAEMCAFGEPVTAREALSRGIVDRLIEGDLLAGAVEFARAAAGRPKLKTRERTGKLADADSAIFAGARAKARKARRGQFAPLAAIDAVEAAARLPFDEGCRRESEIFRLCQKSGQPAALSHAAESRRAAPEVPGLARDVAARQIRCAGIVGAGTMGRGIAMCYANAGIPVLVMEADGEALERAMSAIRQTYESAVRRGKLPEAVMTRRMALITPQLTFDRFDQADVIVEAVFENMALKKQVFAEIDDIAGPGCLLASNTSYLDLDELAGATRRPHMVIGHHFLNPANVMPLLEIVRGKATGAQAVGLSMSIADQLGKVGVLARNCRGFIGNRMLIPYRREAQFLVEEGASVEEVDEALYEFGMAMGPLAMSDLTGLDIAWRANQEFRGMEKSPSREPLVWDLLCALGRYGQKSGRGWYRYDANRNRSPDPETAALIEKAACRAGIERRRIGRGEIIERSIYALVNEGARLLEEGIALRASDIDVVHVCGYGFPAWRGGPMFYADNVGLGRILDRIEAFAAAHGADLWKPAALLDRLARQGATLASLSC